MGRKSFGFAFHPSEALLPGYLFSIKKKFLLTSVSKAERKYSQVGGWGSLLQNMLK